MSESHGSDPRSGITASIQAALRKIAPQCADVVITLDRPKSAEHGDFATNIALQLAKPLKEKPRQIAERLVAALPGTSGIARTEIAGPGFINIFLDQDFKRAVVRDILRRGDAFGSLDAGKGMRVQVEFVSANPTGPLHVGHGRGAAYGASLANVLTKAGYSVEREYYVNDAGRQMDILALSTWLRYLELCGKATSFPENGYRGEYVRTMAADLRASAGEKYVRDTASLVDRPEPEIEARLDALIAEAKILLGAAYEAVHKYALETQLDDCREDLTGFGVTFDQWYSERSLYTDDKVGRVLTRLREQGHLELRDGAVWFLSTRFGDEKDRVVQRENGQYTYFASDIAYHAEKFDRGFGRVVDVWGADHHGYIPRVKGALTALGYDPEKLVIALVQFAVLYRNGQKASMSTRSGEFVTLRDLRKDVGNDAARFFYVLRKSDQHLDFDLDLAKSRTNENPVYYIQYAHARVSSMAAQWGGVAGSLLDADLTPLESDQEIKLLQRLTEYPESIEHAARELSPHVIAFYLKDLAGDFHSYYNATRILVDDGRVRDARLALAFAVRQVLRDGLALLGVGAPESM